MLATWSCDSHMMLAIWSCDSHMMLATWSCDSHMMLALLGHVTHMMLTLLGHVTVTTACPSLDCMTIFTAATPLGDADDTSSVKSFSSVVSTNHHRKV